MRNPILLMALIVLLLGLTGCMGIKGIVYTHVTKPLDVDMNRTPFVDNAHTGNVKHFEFDVAKIVWDTNAIGDIIRGHGMDTVYFAEIETFEILGIWNQYTVHVYGR